MTDQEIAGVVAGLTKAQRKALMSADYLSDGRILVDAGPVIGGSHSTWPQGICRYYSARRDVLTADGEAVRARLMEADRGDR